MKIRAILVAVVICALAATSHGAPGYKVKGGKAYYGKKAMFQVKPVPNLGKGHTYLMNLKGKKLAYIAAYGKGTNPNKMYGKGSNLFHVSFAPTDQGVYMGVDGGLANVLDILQANGVFKNNSISKSGVNRLAKHRYVVMNNIGYRDPAKPQPRGKVTRKNRKKESPEEFRKRMGFSDPSKSSSSRKTASRKSVSSGSSNVSFSIKNNCRKNVKIFIGSKPRYGSGVKGTLSSNSVNSRNGKAGDQLCIVDGRGNPISCMKISRGMGRVSINSSCSGFGR